jgi:ketosteroid isomerase-like protein
MGLLPCTHFDGFLTARSGPARGINAIRKALAECVAMKPTIQFTTRRVVQVQDTALLVADWRFHGTAADGGDVSTSGTSIEVARRQPDGSWRYLIDLPYGLG